MLNNIGAFFKCESSMHPLSPFSLFVKLGLAPLYHKNDKSQKKRKN